MKRRPKDFDWGVTFAVTLVILKNLIKNVNLCLKIYLCIFLYICPVYHSGASDNFLKFLSSEHVVNRVINDSIKSFFKFLKLCPGRFVENIIDISLYVFLTIFESHGNVFPARNEWNLSCLVKFSPLNRKSKTPVFYFLSCKIFKFLELDMRIGLK